VQRGLVEFDDSQAGQVGITSLGGAEQPGVQPMGGEAQGSPLEPIFASTRWTREDVQTLSSLATFTIALIALVEVARG